MSKTQLLVSFELVRESEHSFLHRACVAVDCDDVELLIAQLSDLKKDYPDLRIDSARDV